MNKILLKTCSTCDHFITNGFDTYIDDCKLKHDLNEGEDCKCRFWQNLNGSSTNSEKGSYHWFHTIMASHKHIGEFISEKSPGEEILRDWGKQLFNTSSEMISGYHLIHSDKDKRLSLNQALEYEIRGSWLPQWISFKWGQTLISNFYARKVKRRHNRYEKSLNYQNFLIQKKGDFNEDFNNDFKKE
jgi:hypothetical protein